MKLSEESCMLIVFYKLYIELLDLYNKSKDR